MFPLAAPLAVPEALDPVDEPEPVNTLPPEPVNVLPLPPVVVVLVPDPAVPLVELPEVLPADPDWP